MSELVIKRLKEALDTTFNSFEGVMEDIKSGKLSIGELREKYTGVLEHVGNTVDTILEAPVPNIIIEISDGVIQDIHTDSKEKLKYSVYDADTEYDHYEVNETKPFKDYQALIEDLDANYATEEDFFGKNEEEEIPVS